MVIGGNQQLEPHKGQLFRHYWQISSCTIVSINGLISIGNMREERSLSLDMLTMPCWDFKSTKMLLIASARWLRGCWSLVWKIHPGKSKLIRFGRFGPAQCREKPSCGKPETFDFLGVTHYIGNKLSGEVTVKRKTKRKRQIAQLKRIKLELRKRLHDKPWETGRWLRQAVQGHINYYGVPFNSQKIGQSIEEVKNLWLKSLRRRSQRHRMTWERFRYYLKYWLPKPRIVHPYPEQRFYAKHPR